jgi:hypothetical protein
MCCVVVLLFNVVLFTFVLRISFYQLFHMPVYALALAPSFFSPCLFSTVNGTFGKIRGQGTEKHPQLRSSDIRNYPIWQSHPIGRHSRLVAIKAGPA